MSAPEGRCERTLLPVSMCAHCRGHLDEIRDTPLTRSELGARFEARYSSHCDVCDGPIRAGDRVAVLTDGSGYACEVCLDGDE